MKRLAVIFLLVAFSAPSFAFDTTKLEQRGSLLLEDIAVLLVSSPALMREVADALDKNKVTADQVVCMGMRFPHGWDHLAGERSAPYVCDFAGATWLEIKADVSLSDGNGKVYGTPGPQALKQAEFVMETNPAWSWSDKDPSAGR